MMNARSMCQHIDSFYFHFITVLQSHSHSILQLSVSGDDEDYVLNALNDNSVIISDRLY